MKKAFRTTAECCHKWPQQTQNEGNAGEVFFEGKTIYSFGHHFPIASFVKPDVVLFTTKSVRQVTARHKGSTYSAIPSSIKIFDVPNVLANEKADHKANAEWMLQDARDRFARAKKSRLYAENEFSRALSQEQEAHIYAEMFKVRITEKPICIDSEMEEIIKKSNARRVIRDEKRKAEDERREKIRLANDVERLEKFRAGETLLGNCRLPNGTIPLRLHKSDVSDKGIIETGLGAKVTLKEAKILWHIWQNNLPLPESIGDYHGISLNDDRTVINIGCHKIERQEAERLFASIK